MGKILTGLDLMRSWNWNYRQLLASSGSVSSTVRPVEN